MIEPLHVLIDTSPLHNANAIRGVGAYTRYLIDALQTETNLQIFTDPQKAKDEKIDVTHYPFFDLFSTTLPIKKKTKTVVTIHDVIPLLFPKQYKAGIKGRIKFGHQRLALKSVRAVLTDSISSKNDIVKYLKVSEKKVHVVYLAANPALVAADQSDIQRVVHKYHLPQKYLLYVGDINYNKNLPQLIKALKFLPEDAHLVCVGKNFLPQPIPEWKMIETQMALSDVAERIKFLTNVSGDDGADLSALYSGALTYVQPSLYEGFGLPVLEAMQCKTPVVSAQNSSLVEVGGLCVQFVQTDAESIAAGIKTVLAWSSKERQQRLDEAFVWSQSFSWSKTAAQTVAVYRSLL